MVFRHPEEIFLIAGAIRLHLEHVPHVRLPGFLIDYRVAGFVEFGRLLNVAVLIPFNGKADELNLVAEKVFAVESLGFVVPVTKNGVRHNNASRVASAFEVVVTDQSHRRERLAKAGAKAANTAAVYGKTADFRVLITVRNDTAGKDFINTKRPFVRFRWNVQVLHIVVFFNDFIKIWELTDPLIKGGLQF